TQAGDRVPQRPAQPVPDPGRDRRGQHQLRAGLLPGRRRRRRQMPHPPPVPRRTARDDAGHRGGPRRHPQVPGREPRARHVRRERRSRIMTVIDTSEDRTTRQSTETDFHALNAMLNLYGPDGKIQFDKDRQAAREYFLQHVNPNTVFFHSLREKLDYLVEHDYYEPEVLAQYDVEFIESLSAQAYAKKFRFPTFLGAFKYYTSYTLKTFDGKRYQELCSCRVMMVALTLPRGDDQRVRHLVDEIIDGRFQPDSPNFLYAGKVQRGQLVCSFLLRIEDNMESIGR